jgi:hypothetical protein
MHSTFPFEYGKPEMTRPMPASQSSVVALHMRYRWSCMESGGGGGGIEYTGFSILKHEMNPRRKQPANQTNGRRIFF